MDQNLKASKCSATSTAMNYTNIVPVKFAFFFLLVYPLDMVVCLKLEFLMHTKRLPVVNPLN